jgi:serine/threonine-protein kinase HipA
MEQVKKIVVSMQFDAEEMEVGELVADNNRIFFKYYPTFLNRGLEISPIKLKLNTNINQANDLPFEGLFGVFADSLPDGWGKLLLDRALVARGVAMTTLSPLDRLAYVGSQGMGALIYRPEISLENEKPFKVELDDIAKATKQIIEGTATDVLDEIFKLGGSSGGTRPKILVGYNPTTQHLIFCRCWSFLQQHWRQQFSQTYLKLNITTTYESTLYPILHCHKSMVEKTPQTR